MLSSRHPALFMFSFFLFSQNIRLFVFINRILLLTDFAFKGSRGDRRTGREGLNSNPISVVSLSSCLALFWSCGFCVGVVATQVGRQSFFECGTRKGVFRVEMRVFRNGHATNVNANRTKVSFVYCRKMVASQISPEQLKGFLAGKIRTNNQSFGLMALKVVRKVSNSLFVRPSFQERRIGVNWRLDKKNAHKLS